MLTFRRLWSVAELKNRPYKNRLIIKLKNKMEKQTKTPQLPQNDVMVSADIKKECELMYLQIKNAENRLKELREICEHEDTDIGNYSYRIGVVEQAEICNSCGIVIRRL